MFYHNTAKKRSQRLLSTPSAIFRSLITDIHHARKSIDLEFYIIDADRTGSAILGLLARKARQGVSVRLLVDGFGSRALPRSMREYLIRSGVDLRITGSWGHRRNHRKMTIIDSHTAHVGGVNIADRYAVGNILGVWHDVQLRFEGADVAVCEALFEYDYATAVGRKAIPPAPPSSRDVALYWSEAMGGGAMMRLFEECVSEATHSLIFTTPYFIPTRRMLDIMGGAVKRGVKVEVLIPRSYDLLAIDLIARNYITIAQRRGIDIKVLRGAFVHSKLALIDDRRLLLGSANLDPRSFNLNSELMLSTRLHGVCMAAKEYLHRLCSLATQPRPEELRSPIPPLVARLLEPVL